MQKLSLVARTLGNLISWKSLKESTIDNEGHISFSDVPNGRRTLINVVIAYKSPVAGTRVGLAKLSTPVFEKMVRNDIDNFKTYIEGKTPNS